MFIKNSFHAGSGSSHVFARQPDEADSGHQRELQGKQRCGLYSCPNKGSLGQLKQHCWLKPLTLITSVVYLVTLYMYIREDYLSRSAVAKKG